MSHDCGPIIMGPNSLHRTIRKIEEPLKPSFFYQANYVMPRTPGSYKPTQRDSEAKSVTSGQKHRQLKIIAKPTEVCMLLKDSQETAPGSSGLSKKT